MSYSKKEDHHTTKVLDNLFSFTDRPIAEAETNLKPVRRCKQAIKQGSKLALPTTKKQLSKAVSNASYSAERSNIAIDKPKKSSGKPKKSIAVISVLDIGLLVRYDDRIELKLRLVRNKKKVSEGVIIDLMIDISRLRNDCIQLCLAESVDSFYQASKIAIASQCKWLSNHTDRVGCSLLSIRDIAMLYKLPCSKLERSLISDLALLMKDTTDQRSVHCLPLTIDV
jgi:hypothetical protein